MFCLREALSLAVGIAVSAGLAISVSAQQSAAMPELRAAALKINVDDMDKALGFYIQKLGFEIESRAEYPRAVLLRTDDAVKLILYRVDRLAKPDETETRVGLTLQVNDLDRAIAAMKTAGIKLDPAGVRKEGVGNAITIYDPFGRAISLMHQTIVPVPEFKEPKIYNFGVRIPDMTAGREFYSGKLGFVERSQRYLPGDMPLGYSDNTFGFMLHARPGVHARKENAGQPFYTIVFETKDLSGVVSAFKAAGIDITSQRKGRDGKLVSISFSDPFGNISEVEQAR